MSAYTLISRLYAPTAGVFDFPSLSLSGVRKLQILCKGITATTDGTDVMLTFYVSSAEIVTGYRRGTRSYSSSASLLVEGTVSDTAIRLCSDNALWDVGNATGENFGGLVHVDHPASTAQYKRVQFQSGFVTPSGAVIGVDGIGVMENAGAINGLKIAGTSALLGGSVHLLALT